MLELPPGYYLAEPAWNQIDAELRRAQDAETRLAAENKVFRKYAASGDLGWRGATLLATAAFGAGLAAALVIRR